MVQILLMLMLKVLFTQDSEVKDLFRGASSLNTFCSSAIISSASGLSLFKMTFITLPFLANLKFNILSALSNQATTEINNDQVVKAFVFPLKKLSAFCL